MKIDDIYREVAHPNVLGYVMREGFMFMALTFPLKVYDAIVIRNPVDAQRPLAALPPTERSLEQQIALINRYQLEKAVVIADDISFLPQCPSLKYLEVIPSANAGDGFDYTPLYDLPEIKSLDCLTTYGVYEQKHSFVDYTRIKGLECLYAGESDSSSYRSVDSLKTLSVAETRTQSLYEVFSAKELDTLGLTQCKIRTLDGLEQSTKMQCLYLNYNRSLCDINALVNVKDTLKALEITCCPKITDFSALYSLKNLELLRLHGSNTLPDLRFLEFMPKLTTFTFSMHVASGDLSPCLSVPYVYSERNRKSYNLKDAQLSKNVQMANSGNENIPLWRRLYQ